MRYILCTILICLLYACKKDEMPISEMEHLSLSKAYDYLPMDIANSNQQAIFKNSQGAERRFNLVVRELVTNTLSYYGNQYYSTNQVLINYAEVGDLGFATVRIRAAIFDFKNTDLTNVITCEEGGSPIKRPKEFVFDTEIEIQNKLNYRETYQAFEHSYSDVYFNTISENKNFFSYNQFYYSTSLGIIAFKGRQDDFWALDRFE